MMRRLPFFMRDAHFGQGRDRGQEVMFFFLLHFGQRPT
jgi:hypothetical protein